MKNATTTVLPNPAPATRSAGRPPVVLTAQTWTAVTQSLASQNKSDLVTLSAVASVSVPTMRKLLAEKFGSRILFERGRRGGVTLVAQRKGCKS